MKDRETQVVQDQINDLRATLQAIRDDADKKLLAIQIQEIADELRAIQIVPAEEIRALRRACLERS